MIMSELTNSREKRKLIGADMRAAAEEKKFKRKTIKRISK